MILLYVLRVMRLETGRFVVSVPPMPVELAKYISFSFSFKG